MGNVPKGHAVNQKLDISEYVRQRKGKRVIQRILIANNGMAAVKAIMSMRKWTFEEFGSEKALTFVAMATQDDLNANAEFIRLADSFVEVPSGKNVNNYANVDLICRIAREQGVDAVWPGWGHASENPALPSKLKDAGITFIGPNSAVMSALGDKIAANILAQTAQVPSIPWSGDGLTANLTAEGTIPRDVFMKAMVTTADDAVKRASRIGYPVMIKASEGGGGKGIRGAATAEELRTGFINVQAEVPGSPIFLMQKCTKARHLEVQILGDEYGNTVALSGRDCSTQRRFQKIFEEGPPTIATASTFKKMERAAQRLTQLVGYCGAGTVEYLYTAQRDSFFFLELNPRLQVEHPVTEGITGVNLPAAQLQIAMGIPLSNIPDIRSFYGLDPLEAGPIDFMTTDYPAIQTHVMASRITAENPDEGFKPTSGKIHSIRFQSLNNCWAYFSVGLEGGIHEFADSQFGHVFARGKNRNEARKTLLFALKGTSVVADIRHPVDYLVELLERDDFKENRFDTNWLDGLIAEKLVAPSQKTFDIIFFAAVFRAHELVKRRTQELLASMQKGQLRLLGKTDTDALVSFPVEIVGYGKKFPFQVARSRADTYLFQIGGSKLAAKVREQPDGYLYVSSGDTVQKIKGTEESLGLRLMMGGATVMLPTIHDPSELRSDVNGKVVRYLHDEGAEVAKGEPYVELEAMKMIMALKASEAGSISHTKSAGSIVAAGELLARLQLKDPSKVQKIELFTGEFALDGPPAQRQPEHGGVTEDLDAFLGGFEVDQHGPLLVTNMFKGFKDADSATKGVQELLEKYLANERPFAASIGSNKPYDELLRELIGEHKNSLGAVLSILVAHNRLPERNDVVLAILREIVAAEGSGVSCMYVPDIKSNVSNTDAIQPKISELAQLPSTAAQAGDFGGVRHLAKTLLDIVTAESHEERVATLREGVLSLGEDSPSHRQGKLGVLPDGTVDLTCMVELLGDAEPGVRDWSTKAYVNELCMPSDVTDLGLITDQGGNRCAVWTQHNPTRTELLERRGLFVVLPELDHLERIITEENFRQHFTSECRGVLVNLLHVVVGRDAFPGCTDRTFFYNTNDAMAAVLSQCAEILARKAETLKVAGIGEVCIVLPQPPRNPRFAMFRASSATAGWSEHRIGRDMWPSFVTHLGLDELERTAPGELRRIFREARPTSLLYLAIPPQGGQRGLPELLLRNLYYEQINAQNFTERLSEHLVTSMNEIENAMLDPQVSKFSSMIMSRMFLHFLCELDMSDGQIKEQFAQIMDDHSGMHGAQMLKINVGDIVIKVRRRNGDKVETLLLESTSLGGSNVHLSRKPTSVRTLGSPAFLAGSEAESTPTPKIQLKRAAARRAGSVYAYDLTNLMKVVLVATWTSDLPSPRQAEASPRPKGSPRNKMPAARGAAPNRCFESAELVMDWESMKLSEAERPAGENDIGMVAWKVCLKTLEYPDGRDIVLIANDVTFEAGSFGVREDQFFQKCSEYARAHGIPRIYVSCNSGARVGLVDELKSLYKVHWIDPEDPGKGFEYLYVTKSDYEELAPHTLLAHPVTENGEERYVIDAIIGEGLKSTAGGIGVENLQGSGLIAGETSRAYQDVFTLSYVTGRSVGIGAYLNRLGQRNIQLVGSPMILTGYSALNKLLGKNVYSSQDQLGGPQVMVPNGVTHQVVRDDQEGMAAILSWLSFVPRDNRSISPVLQPVSDPWDRDIEYVFPKQPYNPRDFLKGVVTDDCEFLRGFFDADSFQEYLEGWGRTVVVGRARLGGMPMGVIAVETRSVERFVPADPANPDSAEVVEPQAGQVWFPDSAHKTAQALRDFNHGEHLPVMIFANWRGFSGGTRDMYNEILKYGAQIVDSLVAYEHPAFIYIPPNGELRGGAWVVIDPQINPDRMEMYADVESRGGILEPPGIVEVKYRMPQQVEAMHRHDAKLRDLDAQVASAADADRERLAQEVKARERQLLPLYTSIAVQFADLHDRAGRMKAKGVIRDALEWKNARRFFYWRVRRRVQQDFWAGRLREADKELTHAGAVECIQQWLKDAKVDFDDDQRVVAWLESQDLGARARKCRTAYVRRQIDAMYDELSPAERKLMIAQKKCTCALM